MSRQLHLGESAEPRPTDLRDLVGLPLSEQQLDAATAPLQPGVIVAGAGTGKTTVMAARVVWLVHTGQVAPHQVLGLTFTNKAAAQLAGKVRESLRGAGFGAGDGLDDDEPGEPTISTYHAFASRLIVEHGLRLGIEPTSRLLADASRHQLAYRVVCRTDVPLAELGHNPAALVGELLALDDALAERGVAPEVLLAHDEALVSFLAEAAVQQKAGREMAAVARRRRELTGLVIAFRAAKRERDVIDFADQTRLSAQLAVERPEVGTALREQVRVVMLDEYQDTSAAQRTMLQHLFGEGHPVTAVGDPCQAIYGWRGASVHNIDSFPHHFPVVGADGGRAAATRYPLTQNRRSAPRIIEVANEVARPLRDEHPGVGVLVPGATGKGGGELRCAWLPTYAEEITWVADRIAAMRGTVPGWSDIAVLCRAGTHFGALQRALVERDVPVEVVGTSALLALPEVNDVVSVLRVLHDPTANPQLLRLLSGPRWRLGARDLALLGQRAASVVDGRHQRTDHDLTLDEELDDAVAGSDPVDLVSLSDVLLDLGPPERFPFSPEARERLTALGHEIRTLRRHAGEPLVDLVHRVLTVTGLEVELAATPGAVASALRSSVDSFLDLAADFRDIEGDTTLGAFLRWLDDAERFDAAPDAAGPSDRDAVKLMTVHKAKGLEFGVVVLPFMVEGSFPSSRRQKVWPTSHVAVPHAVRDEPVPAGLDPYPPPDGPRAKDATAFAEEWARLEAVEEVRLGYVAVTRAERRLLASGSTWGPEQSRPRVPGAFLMAVREACLGGAGQVDQWTPVPDDDDTNPALEAPDDLVLRWPVPLDPTAAARRAEAAASVLDGLAALEAAGLAPVEALDALVRAGIDPEPDDRVGDVAGLVAGWDHDLRLVLTELGRERDDDLVVRLPESLSASALMALTADEAAFTAALARPMPRPPSPSARRGTEFHAWVEALHGQQPMLGPDDLPGAADDDITTDAELAELREAFLATAYAHEAPHVVEAAFALVLAGRVVRGRIDAVYRRPDPGGGPDRWEVVDWKTNRGRTADPLQLAVYRLAWAEQLGVPLDSVDATFLYVRTGEAVRFDALPDRVALEARLTG